jgi:hypothetical protein
MAGGGRENVAEERMVENSGHISASTRLAGWLGDCVSQRLSEMGGNQKYVRGKKNSPETAPASELVRGRERKQAQVVADRTVQRSRPRNGPW